MPASAEIWTLPRHAPARGSVTSLHGFGAAYLVQLSSQVFKMEWECVRSLRRCLEISSTVNGVDVPRPGRQLECKVHQPQVDVNKVPVHRTDAEIRTVTGFAGRKHRELARRKNEQATDMGGAVDIDEGLAVKLGGVAAFEKVGEIGGGEEERNTGSEGEFVSETGDAGEGTGGG
ncbi:hypothetical protein HDU96_008362 [Phlyctochytrium bullatum]|nr:hypothetical protein HDU96_008362 [Phlyctochytrium bullatum]